MCNLHEIIRFFVKNSVIFKSVCFNIDRVLTQTTPKCVENGSDDQLSYICSSNYYQFSVTLITTLKTVYYLVRYRTNSLVRSCARSVTNTD